MVVQIHSIWISPGHDFKGHHGQERGHHGHQSMESVSCVAGKGIEGDRYFGYSEDFKGQISFFSKEVAEAMVEKLGLPQIQPSALRRNVLIDGIDLNRLIGQRFRIGDVVFSGSEECAPCYWMNEAVAPGAHEWLKGKGGLRCRIEQSGILKTGSSTLELL